MNRYDHIDASDGGVTLVSATKRNWYQILIPITAMHEVESFSYPVLFVEMLADTGRVLGPATAVLFDVGWRRFLVTNFHVISGRHPFTNDQSDTRTLGVSVQILT